MHILRTGQSELTCTLIDLWIMYAEHPASLEDIGKPDLHLFGIYFLV